ncbi:hypothetical protein EYF80_015094 [Liparis tanakae]|uniref:Uncharacterized protein n=1 Tax=Liparis tanakae TaxID=230148 RepID=A0A4Z2I9T0_9TELE|nr:hypothetical protein EYF80_015094 [Liparis tanakae]
MGDKHRAFEIGLPVGFQPDNKNEAAPLGACLFSDYEHPISLCVHINQRPLAPSLPWSVNPPPKAGSTLTGWRREMENALRFPSVPV